MRRNQSKYHVDEVALIARPYVGDFIWKKGSLLRKEHLVFIYVLLEATEKLCSFGCIYSVFSYLYLSSPPTFISDQSYEADFVLVHRTKKLLCQISRLTNIADVKVNSLQKLVATMLSSRSIYHEGDERMTLSLLPRCSFTPL